MSLVNDMLRDLAGQQPLNVAQDDHAQLLADSSLARKQRRVWLPSLFIFLLVLMLLMLGLNRFFAQEPNISTNELVQVAPNSAVVVEPKIGSAENLIENTVEASAATDVVTHVSAAVPAPEMAAAIHESAPANSFDAAPDESVAVTHAEPALNLHGNVQSAVVAPWLALAHNALAQDRLTSPIEDSAWHYFQQVLAIEPQHAQALQGLAAITARYMQLANEAMYKQEFTRAQTLLRRARMVTPNSEQLIALEAQLSAQEAEQSQRRPELLEQPTMLVGTLPDTQQPAAKGEIIEQQIVAPAQPNSYSLPPPLTIAGSQLQVTPNREWQDQQTVAQARAFMQQGQVERARLQLELFVQQQGEAPLSGQLLCQIYLDQGELVKAAKLLVDADAWPINERVRMHAQIYIAQGDNAAALGLLETSLPQAENDERYRALLASLYHTVGNYHESVASYRRLINIFGEKSAYWLGLALSLDALQQNASALEGYRRAYELQPLQAEVNKYIEQRITVLSR